MRLESEELRDNQGMGHRRREERKSVARSLNFFKIYFVNFFQFNNRILIIEFGFFFWTEKPGESWKNKKKVGWKSIYINLNYPFLSAFAPFVARRKNREKKEKNFRVRTDDKVVYELGFGSRRREEKRKLQWRQTFKIRKRREKGKRGILVGVGEWKKKTQNIWNEKYVERSEERKNCH